MSRCIRTILVDLKLEVHAELSRQAAARGVDIGSYAASLLEEAAHARAVSKILSPEQLDETLREIAQYSDKIPLLPDAEHGMRRLKSAPPRDSQRQLRDSGLKRATLKRAPSPNALPNPNSPIHRRPSRSS
jgi:hypothetical protein